MSSIITVAQDTNGRLNKVTIQQKGKKPLTVLYTYVAQGLSMHIEGNKALLPSYAELLKIIDAKFIQRVEQRAVNIFRNINTKTLAGGTAFWTPEPGKAIRLLGGVVCLSKDAACAGALRISLYLLGTIIYALGPLDISSAALVATDNEIVIPFNLTPDGFLAGPDQILALGLNAALTAGYASATVWGTEE